MGQKSNLLTLKNKSIPFVFVNNSKIIFSIYYFVESLTRLFFIRGIWVVKKIFQIENNFVWVDLHLFFYNYKLATLKNKNISKKNKQNVFSSKNKSWLMFSLLKKYCLKYRINSFLFNFKSLNSFIKKKYLIFFFNKIKYFVSFMFARRFNLFLDFLKITSLFIENLLSIDTFTIFLCQIFKNISHRLHNKYFNFIKTLFRSILRYSVKSSDSNIAGFKFIVSGRLRNKSRASSRLITLGSIPIHSFSKNTSFFSSCSHTLYGVFGFKFWVFRKNIYKK